jgi:prevent-host-death family protein
LEDIHQTVFRIKDRLLIILWHLGGMKKAMWDSWKYLLSVQFLLQPATRNPCDHLSHIRASIPLIFCTIYARLVQDCTNAGGEKYSRPMTQTINASTARQEFSKILNKVFREETRIVVEKSGIPIAAIISAEDLRRLDQLEKERADRFSILDEVKAAFRDIPEAEIKNEIDQAITRVRQTTVAREK